MLAYGRVAEFCRAQLDLESEANAWRRQHAGDASHLRDCDWDRAFLSVWRPSDTVAQVTSDQTSVSHPVMHPQPLLAQE